jgi:hypothetical protein
MLSISLGIPFSRIGLQFAAEVRMSRVFTLKVTGVTVRPCQSGLSFCLYSRSPCLLQYVIFALCCTGEPELKLAFCRLWRIARVLSTEQPRVSEK